MIQLLIGVVYFSYNCCHDLLWKTRPINKDSIGVPANIDDINVADRTQCMVLLVVVAIQMFMGLSAKDHKDKRSVFIQPAITIGLFLISLAFSKIIWLPENLNKMHLLSMFLGMVIISISSWVFYATKTEKA
jgi:hypothetical protein